MRENKCWKKIGKGKNLLAHRFHKSQSEAKMLWWKLRDVKLV